MSATTRGTLINCQVARPSIAVRAQEALHSITTTLRLWRARHRERHSFILLDERDLRDLRLSRWDVERELSKPFWKG